MSDEGLPQGLGGLFRDGGQDRRLDVDLPPGRLIAPVRNGEAGPAYWLSDEPARTCGSGCAARTRGPACGR